MKCKFVCIPYVSNSNNVKAIVSPNNISADRLVGHAAKYSIIMSSESAENVSQFSQLYKISQSNNREFQHSPEYLKPQLFTQAELNDIKATYSHFTIANLFTILEQEMNSLHNI